MIGPVRILLVYGGQPSGRCNWLRDMWLRSAH